MYSSDGSFLTNILWQHVKNAVNFWYNLKERRIHQNKKRKTRAGKIARPKRV